MMPENYEGQIRAEVTGLLVIKDQLIDKGRPDRIRNENWMMAALETLLKIELVRAGGAPDDALLERPALGKGT